MNNRDSLAKSIIAATLADKERRRLVACAFGTGLGMVAGFGLASAHAASQLAPGDGGRFSLGLSLPLTGVQATIASELLAGYQMAADLSNGAMSLVVKDDESNALKTVENIRAFAATPSVLAVSGIVGTLHAEKALPIARELGLPIVGIRSGSQSLRDGGTGVYHLRSSYEDEMVKLAKMMNGAGVKTLAILFSDDVFGRGNRDALIAQLKLDNLGYFAVPMQRDGSNVEKAVADLAEAIKSSKTATGVAFVVLTKPMMSAMKLLREKHKLLTPVVAMSVTATRELTVSADPSFEGLGVVSAFPSPRLDRDSLAINFREDAAKLKRIALVDSLTSFEGYFYGSVVSAAIAKANSRESLKKVLDAGVLVGGRPFNFDANKVGYRYLQIIMKSSREKRFYS